MCLILTFSVPVFILHIFFKIPSSFFFLLYFHIFALNPLFTNVSNIPFYSLIIFLKYSLSCASCFLHLYHSSFFFPKYVFLPFYFSVYLLYILIFLLLLISLLLFFLFHFFALSLSFSNPTITLIFSKLSFLFFLTS